MIKSDFQNDEFEFLNLSYPCPVTYMGLTYLNAMSAFIAMKIPDEFETERRKFTRLNAQKARVKEKSMRVRKDWDSVKGFILREILYAKFSENEDLKKNS